jgi:putative transposase
MRHSFNHVVTSLVPELLGKDAPLNETVAEMERKALEEAERTSPRYAREKEVRRRGYASYKFLRRSGSPSGGGGSCTGWSESR